MQLLTAARGARADDFAHTVPGELVMVNPIVCDRDRNAERDQGCGCGRAFIGLTSGKATTLAVVAELDIDSDALVAIATDALAGMGYHHEDIGDLIADLIEDGQDYDMGTHLRRWIDDIEIADGTT